eukprot:scaffold185964_cov34-Tisochrysis_lutea.AAC.1
MAKGSSRHSKQVVPEACRSIPCLNVRICLRVRNGAPRMRIRPLPSLPTRRLGQAVPTAHKIGSTNFAA